MARKPLDQWIQEAVTDTEKEGPCTQLSLVHKIGTQDEEIYSVKFGGSKRWEAKELAELFQNKASAYCQDLPGVQTCGILAFYGGRKEPQARLPLMVNGEHGYEGNATEGPHAQGLTQQAMRHSEAIVQLAFRQTAMLFESSQRMIDALSKQNEKLMTENHDAVAIIKEVMLKAGQEEHDRRMKELEFERSSAERRKWLSFAPALVNTILGKEIFPESTADTALVETIAESITPEQIGKLAAVLPPELMGPLAARATELSEKKAKEKADSKALVATSRGIDPDEDAGGRGGLQ